MIQIAVPALIGIAVGFSILYLKVKPALPPISYRECRHNGSRSCKENQGERSKDPNHEVASIIVLVSIVFLALFIPLLSKNFFPEEKNNSTEA